MKFDLKTVREQKNLSQQALADAMNAIWQKDHPEEKSHFSRNQIVTLEQHPERIGLEEMIVISQAFGESIDRLVKLSLPGLKAPVVENHWNEVQKVADNILNYYNSEENPLFVLDGFEDSKTQLELLVKRFTRKPKIAVMGKPDAGKSRNLNTLLGKNILPTGWNPTTSMRVYLKHLDCKPSYLKDNVVVIRSAGGGEAWDPDETDEAYFNNWCYEKGDYDLIGKYGTHDGEKAREGNNQEIEAIIVYVNSDMLGNCDFIDLPGFNPTPGQLDENGELSLDRDTIISSETARTADAVIYLSKASDFLYGDDLAMAQTVVKQIPALEKKGENNIAPFGNLFIVASHANDVDLGNMKSLNGIFDRGAESIWEHTKEHPMITGRERLTGYSYGLTELRSRFFTSEMSSAELTKRFHDEFVAFVEELPNLVVITLLNELNLFFLSESARIRDELKDEEALLGKMEDDENFLLESEKDLEEKLTKFRELRYELEDEINDLRSRTKDETRAMYRKIISPDYIGNKIKNGGYSKKKSEIERLITSLNSDLENGITQILADASEKLKDDMNDFIRKSDDIFKMDNVNFNANMAGFNAGRAFAGGIIGLATYGALAAWAATCGNLGGYILVSKAVAALASLGIHLGGTAAVISVVNAIGGPVVIGISIAVLAAVSVILAFGGTWKTLIKNKLVKEYEKKGVLMTLLSSVDQYWDDTFATFRKGVDAVEAGWKEYVRDLREKVRSFDEDATESRIRELKTELEFAAEKMPQKLTDLFDKTKNVA